MSVLVDRGRADLVVVEALLRAKARKTGTAYDAFRRRYRDDPVAFTHDAFLWPSVQSPAPYQDEALALLVERRRLAVRSPHGAGKTAEAAWAVLWFALTRDGEDWKAPTTASSWRQLTQFLWPEIHKWARKLRWDRIGRPPFDPRTELFNLSLRLRTGEAFALASDVPEMIEGAHADHILYVYDEAKAIPDATWDATEGALASGEAFALAISTPGEPRGRFYEIHARRPGFSDWTVRHVSLEDALAARRVSLEWAEQRRLQWGETSVVYQTRVLGEFAANDEEGVIPLSWVEAANERWFAWKDGGEVTGPFTCVSVDVAYKGGDMTVLALRFGDIVTELRRYAKADTMETTGRVAGVLLAYGEKAIVDVVGIGAGVVDRLREQGYNVDAFNAGEGSSRRDRSGELGFANKRAEAWWNMRELLDPANAPTVALPPDDLLTGDLTAPRWKPTSGGKIQVEAKEEVKKRLGRSTDDGDAVVMAFYGDEAIPAWWLEHGAKEAHQWREHAILDEAADPLAPPQARWWEGIFPQEERG